MSRGIVLYEGPSRLDGSPIVVIATRKPGGSENRKTGDMVQTWILRADMDPIEASKEKADGAICGDCPHRRSTGGGCYVALHQAPLAIYRAYKRGSYPVAWSNEAEPFYASIVGVMVRLGAYGDPAAAPMLVWEELLAASQAGHTGYTHQWRREDCSEYRSLCMASCDSPSEAFEAQSRGWRTFTTVLPNEAFAASVSGLPPVTRSIQCLADARDMSCEECGICYGSRSDRILQPASVWIAIHGPLASRTVKQRRSAALKVV